MVKTGRIFRYPAGFLFYTDKILTGCCDRIQKNSRKDDSDVRKKNGEKCEKSLNLRFFTRQIDEAGVINLPYRRTE